MADIIISSRQFSYWAQISQHNPLGSRSWLNGVETQYKISLFFLFFSPYLYATLNYITFGCFFFFSGELVYTRRFSFKEKLPICFPQPPTLLQWDLTVEWPTLWFFTVLLKGSCVLIPRPIKQINIHAVSYYKPITCWIRCIHTKFYYKSLPPKAWCYC